MNVDDDKTLCLYLINKMLWNPKMLFLGGLTSWTAFLVISRSMKVLPFECVMSSRRPKKPKPGSKGQNQGKIKEKDSRAINVTCLADKQYKCGSGRKTIQMW